MRQLLYREVLPKNFGIIQTNHMGVIDESYCGDDDVDDAGTCNAGHGDPCQ